MGRGEGLGRLDAELAREKAAALGRAGERLEAALEETRALDQRLAGAADPVERARLALIIQREAVGVRHHRIVDHLFPELPPRPRA